ncbi:hypothetical protein BLNAU_3250 [Blattamonas nauphoetae]|uniref:Uncharacterized protein n=1 Tax=Blattamonas nauphoetae TaxID=2049346 RepID=A0ABQ9YDH5_9EUKA|nr:hypothetical protein BLNAU_3250 [Blattamonas nauphoetae]
MPPTYTNQEQSETTHQSKPISQQRYTQEDNPTSPNHLSTNPNLPLPDFPPVHLDSPLLLAQHPRNPATRFACPPTPIMSPSNHTLCAVHNWLRVANTREEGSDSEEPGERAEKNEDSTEDTRENESQLHTRRRKVNSVNLNNAVSSQPSRDTNRNETEYEADTQTDNDSEKEQSEPTRLIREIDRLTETMSDFQVLSASLPADKSTLEKSLVQTRKKMEMQREINTRLEERLDETKREVDEWIGMNKKKSHSIETFHTTLDQLTTERDTLKANLTATNQSLDESNQRIYTHSSEVSSLLSQKTELERLLSKNWLITIDT